MTDIDFSLTRRSALFAAVASLLQPARSLPARNRWLPFTRIQRVAAVQVGSSTFKRRDSTRKLWTPGTSMP